MTSHPIEHPRRGAPMRASWGVGVADRVNECADAIDVLRGPSAVTSQRDPTSGLCPFAVRYDAENEKWLVHLPAGCMNVGGSCAPMNANVSGHWYSFALDETAGTTGTDGDGNTYREWTVTAHAKTSAQLADADSLGTVTRRLLFVGAQDALDTSPTDAERYRDTPGDTFACTIATVRVTEVEEEDENGDTVTKYKRQVTQGRTATVDMAEAQTPNFALIWRLRVTDDELEVDSAYCARQAAAVAGINATGDTLTEVTDAGEVYARIDAEHVTNGSGIISVEADPSHPDVSTDFIVWLRLYTLVENTVTADWRQASLASAQLYRS